MMILKCLYFVSNRPHTTHLSVRKRRRQEGKATRKRWKRKSSGRHEYIHFQKASALIPGLCCATLTTFRDLWQYTKYQFDYHKVGFTSDVQHISDYSLRKVRTVTIVLHHLWLIFTEENTHNSYQYVPPLPQQALFSCYWPISYTLIKAEKSQVQEGTSMILLCTGTRFQPKWSSACSLLRNRKPP